VDIELREGESTIDAVIRSLQHRLDRDWDLFNEPMGEVHLARLSPTKHMIVNITHHAAADASTAANFGFNIGRKYFEAFGGGNTDKWSKNGALSTARKRRIIAKERSFKDVLLEAKDAFAPFFQVSQLPAGSGSDSDPRQFQIKRLLNREETEAILGKQGGQLVDKLVCASNLAIDQWNARRNKKPGVMRTSVTVNMKGRFTWFDKPNNSGLIEFETRPEQRTDRPKLTRFIKRSRISQFRRQMDLRFFINVARMNDTFRILPFRIRRRLVHFVMERRQYSIGVTMLGLLNPEINGDRRTGASVVGKCGDIVMREVHGFGYKLLSNTHLVIIAYTYGEYMNLIMATSACHFTREEAEEFLDLVIANVERG
jgi:hypothetical protein